MFVKQNRNNRNFKPAERSENQTPKFRRSDACENLGAREGNFEIEESGDLKTEITRGQIGRAVPVMSGPI